MKSILSALAALALCTVFARAQTLTQLRDTGPRANRVNLVFVSEGYTEAERARFEQHVAARLPALLGDEGWRRFADYVNIFRLFVPSRESGLDIPDEGITRDTAFDAYITNTGPWGFSSEKLEAALLASVPDYDVAILFINTSHSGPTLAWPAHIFMLMPTGNVDNPVLDDILLHELGHAFAGLADEYWNTEPYTGPPSEIRYPNASHETTRERVPWSAFIFPQTPVPTASAPDENTVGVFQGAALRNTFTRPTFNSKMRAALRPWGPVNLKAIADAFHRLNLNSATARPVITQQPSGGAFAAGAAVTLSVQATGVAPITYHWRRNGVYLPGGTDATYTIPSVDNTTAGIYLVEVTNGAGSTLSVDAAVTSGTRLAQTVSIAPIASRPFGAPPFTVAASASSGLPVALRIINGPATISGSTVTVTAGGEVTIEGTQPGDGQYLPASARRTFTVNPIPPASFLFFDSIQRADGAPKPVTASTIPQGLRITYTYAAFGGGTATITPPSAPGLYTVVATIEDPSYVGTASATLLIHGRSSDAAPALQFPVPTSLWGTVGLPFSYQLVATGAPTSFSVAELPAGLQLNATTGLISGTPTAAYPAKTLAVTASNASGFDLEPLGIGIAPPPPLPVITGPSAAVATVGAPFACTILHANPIGNDVYAAENLPAGLSIDSRTGTIAGAPTSAGTFTVTLRVTNYAGGTTTLPLTLTTHPAVAGAPAIGNPAILSIVPIGTLSCQLVASNAPTSFSIESAASWLTVDARSGVLGGAFPATSNTPTHVALRVANSAGTTATTILLLPNSSALNMPTLRATAWPAGRNYLTGEALDVTLTFASGAVAVTGTPRLPLVVGSRLRHATYVSGGGTDRLVFRYTVEAADVDTDGVVFGNYVDLNGGTMGSTFDRTPAYLYLPRTDTSTVRANAIVDTAPPNVLELVWASFDPATAVVTARLRFTKPVTGVDAADFTIAPTGSAAGTVRGITPSGDGTTYLINIGLAGSGDVALRINAAGTGITDASGNAFTGGGVSSTPAFTLSPPLLEIAASQTTTGTVNIPMSYQVVAIGASSYQLAPGSPPLPEGLSLDAATGVLRGTPTTAGTRTVVVQVRNAAGSREGNLVININPAASAPEINVTGRGVTITSGDTTPAASDDTDFGTVPMESMASARTFTIHNTGTVPLTLTGQIFFSGADRADFFLPASPAAGTAIAPGGSVWFSASVVPRATGLRTAVINIPNNDADEGSYTFAVQVAGGPPLPRPDINVTGNGTTIANGDMTPSAADGTDFGTATVGSAVTRTFTIQNVGDGKLTIPRLPWFDGASGADFVVAPAPAMPAEIAAGGSLAITVRFTPGAAGLRVAQMNIPSDDGGETPYIFALHGTAEAATGGTGTSTTIPTTPPITAPQIPVITPPAATTPPATTVPPASSTTTPTTTPPTAPAGQRIDFTSPVGSFVIGQPITLSASSSANLPIAFSLVSGSATLNGNILTPTGPGPIVVRAVQAGNTRFAPATAEVNFGHPQKARQSIALTFPTTELLSDGTLALAATSSSGLPVSFEVVSGPARVEGGRLRPTAETGSVTVRAVQGGSAAFDAVDATRTLTIVPATRLVNLSSRVMVRAGDASRSFIAGFVVSGTAPKRMLVRAVGAALRDFGVQAALPDPRLRVFDDAGRVVAASDDWSGAEVAAAATRVGAFALPGGSRDAALLVTLAPGAYSLHIEATAGDGIALAEVYDASDAPALEQQQLANLSTRAFVDTGEGALTTGFVVTGSRPKRVLIRGIGPALGSFGVPSALADATLRVYQGSTVIAQNDDWQVPEASAANGAEIETAAASVGAFALPARSKDAAVLLTLAPGAYTATLSGANGTTGAGLIEVYQVSEP